MQIKMKGADGMDGPDGPEVSWMLSKLEIHKGYLIKKLQQIRQIHFNISNIYIALNHPRPTFLFYTPWKYNKTRGFVMFSGVIERKR